MSTLQNVALALALGSGLALFWRWIADEAAAREDRQARRDFARARPRPPREVFAARLRALETIDGRTFAQLLDESPGPPGETLADLQAWYRDWKAETSVILIRPEEYW